MSIAPIVRTIQVKAPPARAFELFATRMADWWPKGRTVGKKPHVAIIAEPRAGGHWFERDADGDEMPLGQGAGLGAAVAAAVRLAAQRHFTYDPDFLTEVELTFAPVEGGGTMVTLEHRNLERFGADAARVAEHSAAAGQASWPTTPQFSDSQT